MARSHHVGLEQSPLQVHMMVTQGLVHSSQDLGIREGLLRFGVLATYAPCLRWVGMTVKVSIGSDSQVCSRIK